MKCGPMEPDLVPLDDDHECYIFWEVRVEDSKEVTFKPREELARVGMSNDVAEVMCKQAIQEAKQSRA